LFIQFIHSAISVTDDVSIEGNIVFDEFERAKVEMFFFSTRYSSVRMEIPNKTTKALIQEDGCCGRDLSRPLRGRNLSLPHCVAMTGAEQHEV
jgi:hypothetical protein